MLKRQTTAANAVELYKLLDRQGIQVWIDGGWGVDALLGRQTRKHDDLDIAVRHSDVSALRKLLERHGYREAPRDDSWDCNFVLTDDQGHQIDVHSFEVDLRGENTFGIAYRAEHLTGIGTIDGYEVRCVSPSWMVKFHTGYPLDKNDFMDVRALCERFDLEMPAEHKAHWDVLRENKIRSETDSDCDVIREIHRLAFGGSAEAKLVDDLRQNGDAVFSLVAERNRTMIGHLLLNELQAPMKALGLAPVAVHPCYQKRGIGMALIREALGQARQAGWMCVFVLGDPVYYGRFGFRVEPAKGYGSPYSSDHFMMVSFGDLPKTGQIVYPTPFKFLP